MLNRLLVIAGKIIYQKPTVHTNAPKMIVSNFKNSIDKNPLVLNLGNVHYLRLKTELEKIESKADVYKLVADFQAGNNQQSVTLANFETKKEADDAMYLLTYKLYSPLKGFCKLLLTVALISGVVIFSKDMLGHKSSIKSQAEIYKSLSPAEQKAMREFEGFKEPSGAMNGVVPESNKSAATNAPPGVGGVPTLSDEELKALFEQAQKLTAEMNGGSANGGATAPNVGEPAPEQNIQQQKTNPNASPADNFLGKL